MGMMTLTTEYKRIHKDSQLSLLIGSLYLLGAKFHDAMGFENVKDGKHTSLFSTASVGKWYFLIGLNYQVLEPK